MNHEQMRKEAERRLKAKQAFWRTAGIFAIVAIFLTGVWYFSGRGYFWPAWAWLGMGIALAFTGLNAYGPRQGITEAQIQEEMRKMDGDT